MRDPNSTTGFVAGHLVQTVDFQYPDDHGPELDFIVDDSPSDAAQDALETLQHGLLLVLDGHKDGAQVRAGALCFLSGLFHTPTEAAQKLRVHPSTLSRAIEAMKRKLSANAKSQKRIVAQ